MKTWAAVAAFLTLPLAACSSEGSEPSADAPAPATTTVTVTETASAEPDPLEVTLDSGGSICYSSGSVPDIAWFDVTWKANVPLDSLRFELIDPVNVRQVGPAVTVPPTNFGGRIDFGGATAWDDRAEVLDDKFVSWVQRGPLWTWSPIDGESGLLVLHLRMKGTGGFGGVTAEYRTGEGETGSVTAPATYTFRPRC